MVVNKMIIIDRYKSINNDKILTWVEYNPIKGYIIGVTTLLIIFAICTAIGFSLGLSTWLLVIGSMIIATLSHYINIGTPLAYCCLFINNLIKRITPYSLWLDDIRRNKTTNNLYRSNKYNVLQFQKGVIYCCAHISPKGKLVIENLRDYGDKVMPLARNFTSMTKGFYEHDSGIYYDLSVMEKLCGPPIYSGLYVTIFKNELGMNNLVFVSEDSKHWNLNIENASEEIKNEYEIATMM